MRQIFWTSLIIYLSCCIDKELYKAIEYLKSQVEVVPLPRMFHLRCFSEADLLELRRADALGSHGDGFNAAVGFVLDGFDGGFTGAAVGAVAGDVFPAVIDDVPLVVDGIVEKGVVPGAFIGVVGG